MKGPKPLVLTAVLGCLALGPGGCRREADSGGTATVRVGEDFATAIAGPLVRVDGVDVPADAIQGKTVLVYFSAGWCPPCHVFTPLLVRAYETWKQAGRPVEVVLVSGDENEADMMAYMDKSGMAWPAVPYADRERAGRLAERWDVPGFPTLVVVSPEGKTLTTDGVEAVYRRGATAIDDWVKP